MRDWNMPLIVIAMVLMVVMAGPAFACNLYGGGDLVVCTLSDVQADVPQLDNNKAIIFGTVDNAAGTVLDQILVGIIYAINDAAEERGGILLAYTSSDLQSGLLFDYSNSYGANKIVYGHIDPGRVVAPAFI